MHIALHFHFHFNYNLNYHSQIYEPHSTTCLKYATASSYFHFFFFLSSPYFLSGCYINELHIKSLKKTKRETHSCWYFNVLFNISSKNTQHIHASKAYGINHESNTTEYFFFLFEKKKTINMHKICSVYICQHDAIPLWYLSKNQRPRYVMICTRIGHYLCPKILI